MASKPGLLRNLQIGFGLSLLILVITSVASYSSIRNLLRSSRLVDRTDSVINELNVALSTVKDAETGQRGYLLSNDTAFLRPYWGSRERALLMLDRVQSMTVDNPLQQENCKELRELISNRLTIVQDAIEEKRKTGGFSQASLEKGREYMDEIRNIVQRMQDEEHRLLVGRTETVNTYTNYTSVLIITAAIFSILITLFFYRRVHRDFLERQELFSELQQNDADTARRIRFIGDIADRISEGHYQTRVSDEQKDALGALSLSLNKMAASLEYAFGQLSDKEWIMTGVAGLAETMVGETVMTDLATHVIAFVAEYTHSEVGAFYIRDRVGGALQLVGSYALGEGGRKTFRSGQGMVGQAA